MAGITENLKKILTAVYGKDVRQAIHDSIKQCGTDMENGIKQCRNMAQQVNKSFGEILELLTLPVEGIVRRNNYVWQEQGHGTFTVLLFSPYGENISSGPQCASVEVEAGATYKVDTYIAGDAPKWIAIAAIQGSVDQTQFTGSYTNIQKGEWVRGAVGSYLVTIPEGNNLLLVTSESTSYGDIQIRKLRI